MNILITGGASGLGKAITIELAKEPNHNVYFTYNKSISSAKEISNHYKNTFGHKCDFLNHSDLEKLADNLEQWDIDVLINNAFVGFKKKHFHKLESQYIFDSFRNNVIPTLSITQKILELFKRKKSGKIITILSSSILSSPPIGWSEYVANKNYLHSMSKSWASEYRKFNITSNCISPSFMLTNLNNEVDDRIIENMIDKHPLKQLLLPDEVADAVKFLVNASQHINGTNMIINSADNVI